MLCFDSRAWEEQIDLSDKSVLEQDKLSAAAASQASGPAAR